MTQIDDHRPEQDEVAQVVRAAGRRPVPPAGAYEQVLDVATAAWERKVRQRHRRATWGRLAAAAAVVAAGLGVWLNTGSLPGTPIATVAISQGEARQLVDDSWLSLDPEDTIEVPTDLKTGNGGVIALQLATGVQLRVAADTQLHLRSADDIELTAGRVYIDSDRFSLGGDLRLLTPFGEVHDIGTQFQVDVSEARLRVRIREGEVYVARPNLRVDGGVGEEIQVNRQGQVGRTAFPTYGREWRWAEALATPFSGGSLKDFLIWIARENGYVLEFEDAGTERLAATVTVSGNTEGFTLEEALEAQKPTAPSFDYDVRDGVIHVFRYPQQ